MSGDHLSTKPAQYKCMSVITVIIISVSSYQMSFKVLLPPTFVLPQKNGRANPSSPDITYKFFPLW